MPLGGAEALACTAGAGELLVGVATPAGAAVPAGPPVAAGVDGAAVGAGRDGGATAGAAFAGATCAAAGAVGAATCAAAGVGAVCVGAVCVGATRAAGAAAGARGAVGAGAAVAAGAACAGCAVGLPGWAGVGRTPAGGRPVGAGCAARAARPSPPPEVDVRACCPVRAATAGILAGACAGGVSPVAPELGPGSLREPTTTPGSADPALAGASSGAGAPTRFSPSRSARRRTRSAWASSMLEEWLFTPMPIDRQRSRPSLLDRPSSRASS